MTLGKSKLIKPITSEKILGYFWANQKNILIMLFSLVFITGQVLILFKGNLSLGVIVSFFSVLGGFCSYFYGDRWLFPLLKSNKTKTRSYMKPDAVAKNTYLKTIQPGKKMKGIPNKRILILRGIELLAAFILGGVGQWFWIQSGNSSTLGKGAIAFFVAALLLIHGLSPWFREGLQRLSLSIKWELIILGIILAIAVFFRVYRIDTIPSGLFIDQGFEGYSALRILHEGWRPFYVEDIFHAYALALYMLAAWFKAFGSSEITLKLFYASLAIIAMPLIYWTFRQLAGPRMALLTIFILAVMRWNVNFSRNGFPTVQLTLYIFGTLAFLLYGLKNGKRWAFLVAAFFFAAGFYTYQAFKIFPLLLLIYASYEWFVNKKMVKKYHKFILGFVVLALILTAPLLFHMVKTGTWGTREGELMSRNFKQFINVLFRTALMFNRQGDPNPRHNLQDYRMLDDVSGVLLVLGLAYAVMRCKRRKYFYSLAGFFVMSLPCILSIDPAHANRMFGMTPYMAFLIATPLGALWGRVADYLGMMSEKIFLSLLLVPLGFMSYQNFDVYFNKQANNFGSWAEYSCVESAIGRAISQRGPSYEYFISPNYFNHFTISFLGYSSLSQIHSFDIPGSLIPLQVPTNRGLFFALQEGRTGILNLLQSIYPQGKAIYSKNILGKDYVYFFEVPPSVWAKFRGLTADISTDSGSLQVPEFPNGLPTGPYHASFSGSVYFRQMGRYRFLNLGEGNARLYVKGIPVLGSIYLCKGYRPIRIDWDAPPGVSKPDFALKPESGVNLPLNSTCLTTTQISGGLNAEYFPTTNWKGKTTLSEWEPTPNFANGNDFPLRLGSILWAGKLRIDKTGVYEFYTLTDGQARLLIDSNEIIPIGMSRAGKVELTRGKHRLELFYNSPTGFSNLSLKWRKPGMKDIEVIPETEFDSPGVASK